VDPDQERELRTWAGALSESDESDRKAMGRAILMLLGQIESLRAELERSPAEPPSQEEAPGVGAELPIEPPVAPVALYDGSTGGVRGWLRATVQRNHSTKPDGLSDAGADATVDDQRNIGATPAAGEDERRRMLRRDAEKLAGDPADQAEIAELRADLDDPLADLPA
jgi:hypothetical protein